MTTSAISSLTIFISSILETHSSYTRQFINSALSLLGSFPIFGRYNSLELIVSSFISSWQFTTSPMTISPGLGRLNSISWISPRVEKRAFWLFVVAFEIIAIGKSSLAPFSNKLLAIFLTLFKPIKMTMVSLVLARALKSISKYSPL